MSAPARILVVEDDASMRELLQTYLHRQGYVVTAACDGDVALPILRSDEPFDLLVTDVVMPGTRDGFALAREARRMRPGLKVMHVTGCSDRVEEHPDLVRRGALLRKPVGRRELVEWVERLLGCWAAEQNETLRTAYDYWLAKAAGRGVPDRKDLNPAEITTILPDLCIIEPVGTPPRYRCRLVGTRVVEALGFDPVNRFIDDIFARKSVDVFERMLEQVYEREQPLYAATSFRSADCSVCTERLLLPFSVTGAGARQIVMVQTFDWVPQNGHFYDVAHSQPRRADSVQWPHH